MNFSVKILIFLIFANISLSANEQNDIDRSKNTKLIKKLSLVPGLGQIYNDRLLKGGFFAFSQIYFLSKVATVTDVAMRNSYGWTSLFIYILNIIDAQVDFELSTFPDENNLKDFGDD